MGARVMAVLGVELLVDQRGLRGIVPRQHGEIVPALAPQQRAQRRQVRRALLMGGEAPCQQRRRAGEVQRHHGLTGYSPSVTQMQ